MAHLLGIDLGSSSIKVSLVDSASGKQIAASQQPRDRETLIDAPQVGWAEQDPHKWWQYVCDALSDLQVRCGLSEVAAIGIAYQMHGLVMLDAAGEVVRPSIIWCDSRAVEIGATAAARIGLDSFSESTLNSPANFTASKWAWVAKHEPQLLEKVTTVMLPGDYIAYRLSGQRTTTASGLSEMILWNFKTESLAQNVLSELQLDATLLPPTVPTFAKQGEVTAEICTQFGFRQNTPLTYRAGDQPNNAYSLNVLNPGETAATAGTSGVVYAVSDALHFDKQQRVNSFLHVNAKPHEKRLGILLCVNGTGSAYAWLRRLLNFKRADTSLNYDSLNDLAIQGSEQSRGLYFYPWGNGAERMLSDHTCASGARLEGLQFARHGTAELCAAVQDGIAAAMAYGTRALAELGGKPNIVRAGRANLFQSDRFCQTFAQLVGAPLELYQTDGAQGAARAAGVGGGIYNSHKEALQSLQFITSFEPQTKGHIESESRYATWVAGIRE